MVHQTTVQNSAHVRFGSAKFEVAAYGTDPITGSPTWYDLGAMTGVDFKENFTPVRVDSDNAGIVTERVKDQLATISGNMMEIALAKLRTMRGGLDPAVTITAAEEVADHEEVITFSTGAGADQRIPHPNFPAGVATILTIESVTSATSGGGTAYAVEDDWSIYMDSAGYTHIVRAPAGDITATGTVYVKFHYTPPASTLLTTGGNTSQTAIVLRLTSTDQNSKTLVIVVYKAYYREGLSFPFQSDDADTPNTVRATFQAELDTSRAIGDQLFRVTLQE
jgi:hypothetical protein